MKKFIFFLLILLFSSFALADLQIVAPKNTYYPVGKDISLDFQVYNSTSFLVSNTSTSCGFRLYNGTGDQVLFKNFSYSPNIGFYTSVNRSFLPIKGVYSYAANCQGPEAGFLASTFEITEDGRENKLTSQSVILAIAALILAFLILAAIVDKEHIGLKLGAIILAVTFMLLIPSALLYLEGTSLLLYKIITYAYRGFWAYLIFYFIWQALLYLNIIVPKKKTDKK